MLLGSIAGSCAALAACGPTTEPSVVAPTSVISSDAGTAPVERSKAALCPQGMEPGRNDLRFDDLRRDGYAGLTEIIVVFCNPLIAAEQTALIFHVTLSDHLGIPETDIVAISTLRTSLGHRIDRGFWWEGDDLSLDEHHARGLLKVPRMDSTGADMVGDGTSFFTLVFDGVGGERAEFRWDAKHFP